MSSASQCAFDAPPLPRYRYHRKTGTWRPERVRATGDVTAREAHDGSGGAAVGASPAGPRPASAPFESSYDFFLRSVKPPPVRRAAGEREALKREATRGPIRDFEAALFRNQSFAAGGRRMRAASASLRSRRSADGSPLAPTTTTAATAAPHPLIGFASTASIPAAYAALAALKPRPLNFAAHAAVDDRLSRHDFFAFLRAVGPVEVLSASYQETMFRTLPSYEAATDTVEVLALLTLLLEHRYHPLFDSNVAALFRCFDVDGRGAVALEALHPDVIMAWAEVRTFGTLRDQWRRLSTVLADEMHNAETIFPHMPELVQRNAVGALLACTEALYAAACTLDLDGGSL